MRVAEGLICDVERGEKALTVGLLGEFEGLAFKKRSKKKLHREANEGP